MQGVWLQHSLDEKDGDGTQQAVSPHLVLRHAPHDIYQTSAFRKGDAASMNALTYGLMMMKLRK